MSQRRTRTRVRVRTTGRPERPVARTQVHALRAQERIAGDVIR